MPPTGGGLTQREADRRLAARGEVEPAPTSRSWSSILRANLLTVFNVTLLFFGIITLIFGDWRDALFLGILILNAGIGIVQEARAKASLDRLAALVAPRATVVRDGRPIQVGVSDVVTGDLVVVGAGDQVVADGTLARADALGVDESILTGEAEPVTRAVGQQVRAGSFAVEGTGAYVAEAVGPDTYAERLVGEAREFRHPRSPLELALDRLVLILGLATVPLALLLGWSLIEQDTRHPRGRGHGGGGRHHDRPRGPRAARGADLRGRHAPDGAPRGAEPAAQRRGVARVHRRHLSRQDGDPHRGGAARRRARGGRGRG